MVETRALRDDRANASLTLKPKTKAPTIGPSAALGQKPCSCEGVARLRRATPSHKHGQYDIASGRATSTPPVLGPSDPGTQGPKSPRKCGEGEERREGTGVEELAYH